jgi:hypothetical protein
MAKKNFACSPPRLLDSDFQRDAVTINLTQVTCVECIAKLLVILPIAYLNFAHLLEREVERSAVRIRTSADV